MKQYKITRITGSPNWENIPVLNVDHLNWTEETDVQMCAQICYDEQALYVHMRSWEKNIRAEYTGPLADVYQDSCMEFFFCPEVEDPRYFNIEMNPNGSIHFGFGYGNPRPIRIVLPDEDALLQKKTRYTEDGWEVFYIVPLSLIQEIYPQYRLGPGRKMRANCYKCGDKTVVPHYLSWNPMTSTFPCYHRPEDFGEMEFV